MSAIGFEQVRNSEQYGSLGAYSFGNAARAAGGRAPAPGETIDIFGVEVPARLARTPEEIRVLKREIATLARVFSNDYGIEVLPGSLGTWACGLHPSAYRYLDEYMKGTRKTLDDLPHEFFRPKQIFYEVEDLKSAPREEVFGVLRHEVGHANHSDYRLLVEGQRFAKEQGYLPTSWAHISNALEDPWINNLEIAGSEVVREQMRALYAARLPEIVEKVGSQPVSHQLALNIIHYWATGHSIPTLTDKKVLEVFEQIRPYAEKFFSGASAAENHALLKEKIWPEYAALLQKAQDDQELKELARRQRAGGETSRGGSPGKEHGDGRRQQGSEGAGEQSGDSFAQRVWRQVKRIFGGDGGAEKQRSGGAGESAPENEPEKEQEKEGDPKDATDQPFEQQLERELQQQEREAARRDRQRNASGSGSTLPDDIDLSKLSEEIQKELRARRDALSGEERSELERAAREQLERRNVEELEHTGSRMLRAEKDERTGEYRVSPQKGPREADANRTKREIERFENEEAKRQAEEAAAEAERVRAIQEAQLKKALQARDMLKNGFEERELQSYVRFKELESAMQGRVASFVRSLAQYLPKKQDHDYGGAFYTGQKIDMDQVIRRAPVDDYRVFQRREPHESLEPRMFVQLIIDNSGSMSGEKMEESLKTAIFWARVLKEFEVPFAIKLFDERHSTIMKLGQDYDDRKLRIKARLVSEASANGGATDMGAPLKEAGEEMRTARRRYPDSFGAVFVISDSGANRGMVGTELKKLIQEMQEDHLVMNFILATNADEVTRAKAYFGDENVIAPSNFKELPNESFRVLRVVLDRVMRRYRS